MIPVMFAARKIDSEDPQMVQYVRIAYGVIQSACLLMVIYAYFHAQSIAKALQSTLIYVPPPPQPFADPNSSPKKYTQITYGAHLLSTARSLLGSTLFGMALTLGLHYYKGMLVGLTMQAVMGPLNLIENPLIKALLLGNGIQPQDKIFNEKSIEEVEPDAQIVNEQGNPVLNVRGGGGASNSSSGAALTANASQPSSFEDILLDTWDAGASADVAQLVAATNSKNCNYATKEDRWTPLMILAGLKHSKGIAAALRTVIELGGNVAMQDKDGWTPLHWAAFHGSAEAAQELSNNVNILQVKDKDGLTPLDMAKKENNIDVADIYEAAMKDSKKSK